MNNEEFEVVNEEPQEMPEHLMQGLRELCGYLAEKDVHAAVIGVPAENGEGVHSLAVVYHGTFPYEIPMSEKH